MLFQQMLLGSPISFLETSQFFIHLQPPYKSKKIMSFFSQKDYKMLHRPVLAAFYFLYILKNIFRNSSSLFFRIFRFISAIFCKSPVIPGFCRSPFERKCPEAFLSLRAFRSEYLLQMQQHLCNVEVDQQRGGIHNGGDQG